MYFYPPNYTAIQLINMKKALIISSIIAITATTLTSCKKNYECECEKSNNVVEMYTVNASNIIDAQKNCDKHGLEGECEIK